MREIKYRQPIWISDKFHEWHYWGFVDKGAFTGPCYHAEKALKESLAFTGAWDKAGNAVYHKDVCRGNWPYATICLVEWDDKRCGFYLKPLDGLGRAAYDKGYKLNSGMFRVIGNAVENSELLVG